MGVLAHPPRGQLQLEHNGAAGCAPAVARDGVQAPHEVDLVEHELMLLAAAGLGAVGADGRRAPARGASAGAPQHLLLQLLLLAPRRALVTRPVIPARAYYVISIT